MESPGILTIPEFLFVGLYMNPLMHKTPINNPINRYILGFSFIYFNSLLIIANFI